MYQKRHDNEFLNPHVSKGRPSDQGLLMLDSGRPSIDPIGR